MSSKGAVEGAEASFNYDGERFTYRRAPENIEETIENDCIVGFLPRRESLHEHVLLYAHVDEAKEAEPSGAGSNTETSPAGTRTFLRSLRITEPPENLVRDYAPGSLSWLLPLDTEQSGQQSPPDTAKPWHRITVIISTNSGSHSAEAVFKNLLEPFLAAIPANYHVLRTTSANTITDYTRSTILPNARQGRAQTLILLSGDGGPVDVLNAILDPNTTPTETPTYTPPTIALLPLGTGNALANSTHIAASRTMGLATLLRGHPAPLPLFRATLPAGSYPLDSHARPVAPPATGPLQVHGAVVFSWALHASLVADSDTDAYRAHGAARFQMAAKANLFPDRGEAEAQEDGSGSPHVYRGTVRVSLPHAKGEVVIGGEHAYLIATLVSHLEASFCISPASRAMDGKLRIVRLPPMEGGGKGVMRVMEMAYRGGRHVGMDGVGYEEVEGVWVRIEEVEERWRRVCVDGKIYVVGEGGEVEVRRAEGVVVRLVVLGGDGGALENV